MSDREDPARERKRKRIMKAFDTNPLLCVKCNYRFSHLHQKVIEHARAETWDALPEDWREKGERPEFTPLICPDPRNCPLPATYAALFDDPPKIARFPGKRKRAALRKAKQNPPPD